jgi:hypothetical protein
MYKNSLNNYFVVLQFLFLSEKSRWGKSNCRRNPLLHIPSLSSTFVEYRLKRKREKKHIKKKKSKQSFRRKREEEKKEKNTVRNFNKVNEKNDETKKRNIELRREKMKYYSIDKAI